MIRGAGGILQSDWSMKGCCIGSEMYPLCTHHLLVAWGGRGSLKSIPKKSAQCLIKQHIIKKSDIEFNTKAMDMNWIEKEHI